MSKNNNKKSNNENIIKIGVICAVVLVIIGISFVFINTKNTDSYAKAEENNSNEATMQTEGIVINKADITSTAKFYKYKSGKVDIEVIAVKASDGSIRTALNTCQICYDSGRGYYKQQGSYLICQNCGNRFSLNQIEKIKGGCNPVPILAKDKTETEDIVVISKEYLDSQKEYFLNWK